MLGDVESIRFCPRKYSGDSCIAVATKSRTYYLRGSRTELTEWISSIEDATKALRYTTTLKLVRKDVHLLTLVLRDPALGTNPEKVVLGDEEVNMGLEDLSFLQILNSEWLFTHERLAIQRLCHLGFPNAHEGGELLLRLCEYCWTRETREVPRLALVTMLGLGADPSSALRFYRSTDWVKEYKSEPSHTHDYINTTTTTSTNVDGTVTNTTVTRQGTTVHETSQTLLWSSNQQKKQRAPSTFEILDDHLRWSG